jgi:hypothetical protein
MLQTTRTEFQRATGVASEWGMKHNEDDTLACVAYGYFEPVSLTRTVTVYGDGAVKAWRWTGKLPRGIDLSSGWRARATVQGKDREFEVQSAMLVVAWTVELTEVQ